MWTLDAEQACIFGALTDSEKVEMTLSNIPDHWKINFTELGGNHQMTFSQVVRMINNFDAAEI